MRQSRRGGIVAEIDMADGVQEVQPVLLVSEDRFLFITSGGDVIHCSVIFDAKRACHDKTVADFISKVKSKDLTLIVAKARRLEKNLKDFVF